jgi:hypothetical protein
MPENARPAQNENGIRGLGSGVRRLRHDSINGGITKNAGWNQENVILMSDFVKLTSKDKRADSQSIGKEKRILIP